MPQVKYIAKCDKTDSIRGVGLQWTPGQVRNVTSEVAERLLVYPDTWELAGNDTTGEPIPLAVEDKPVEEPLPVVNFHAMNKAALLEFAEQKYNVKLDKRETAESLRHKVIDLFGKHEMEQA